MKGKRILILRPAHQAETLEDALQSLGADVVAIPAIEIVEPASYEELDAAIEGWHRYNWIVFTSANGVNLVASRTDLSSGGPRLAAVGSATRETLQSHGASDIWVPSSYTTETLAAELPAEERSRVLIFRAAEADSELETSLSARGMDVLRVDVYGTRPINAESIRSEISKGPDVIVFTSASIVRSFADAIADSAEGNWVACSIGPATSEALTAAGIPVTIRAKEHTVDGIVDALSMHFAED